MSSTKLDDGVSAVLFCPPLVTLQKLIKLKTNAATVHQYYSPLSFFFATISFTHALYGSDKLTIVINQAGCTSPPSRTRGMPRVRDK